MGRRLQARQLEGMHLHTAARDACTARALNHPSSPRSVTMMRGKVGAGGGATVERKLDTKIQKMSHKEAKLLGEPPAPLLAAWQGWPGRRGLAGAAHAPTAAFPAHPHRPTSLVTSPITSPLKPCSDHAAV